MQNLEPPAFGEDFGPPARAPDRPAARPAEDFGRSQACPGRSWHVEIILFLEHFSHYCFGKFLGCRISLHSGILLLIFINQYPYLGIKICYIKMDAEGYDSEILESLIPMLE